MNQTSKSEFNKKKRQVYLYEKAFARDTNLSGFLMSDNFFLKKLTGRLNESERKSVDT